MKTITLTLATLCLAVIVQANVDYQLRCTKDEIGIRWPSYHSNSDYYICQRVGGRQMLISCNPGELFTFVLQACTSPSKFIPPPPMDVLPTSSPHTGNNRPNWPSSTHGGHIGGDIPLDGALPIPLYPSDNVARPNEPPIIIDEHPIHWEMPAIPPPHVGGHDGHIVPPHVDVDKNELPGTLPPVHPTAMNKPPGKKPMLPPSRPHANAPLPPTPAPTPPVVQDNHSPLKKPAAPSKKQPPAPGKKQPPVPMKKAAKKQMPPVPTKV